MNGAILVNSCLAYSDSWEAWIKLHRNYWQSCIWRAILVTDHTGDHDLSLWDEVIELGVDRQWCGNLLMALDRLEDKCVMITQEDFWLRAPVLNSPVNHARVRVWYDNEIGCMRLGDNPPATVPGVNGYGEHLRGEMYRFSAAPAWWKVDYLRNICNHHATVMDFYLDAPRCDRCLGIPYTVLAMNQGERHIDFWDSAIVRGKWSKDAVRFAANHGIEIDTSRGFYEEE